MVKKILLCDDEAHILRAMEIKLKTSGFEVFTALDGQAGWEFLEQSDSLPDLVITDCQMPRLDGLSLIRKIRSSSSMSSLKTILLTAKGYELSEEDLKNELGIEVLLTKPFSPRKILEKATELTSDKPAENPFTKEPKTEKVSPKTESSWTGPTFELKEKPPEQTKQLKTKR
ncbi:MAG: response regulator [Pirellulaceae bacterium]|nr:response regulator [Pirellulaceae bacterium]